MTIVIVRIPGHPTKSAAQDTLTIMQAGDGYRDGSGSVLKEGSTWTAEASFDGPDPKTAVARAIGPAPRSRPAARKKTRKKPG